MTSPVRAGFGSVASAPFTVFGATGAAARVQ
jgi:hypothetical protein